MKRMSMNPRKQNSVLNSRKSKLRKEDEVIVISGQDRGKRGKILDLDLKKGRVVVQGIRMAKKNPKPTQENPKPATIKVELPIDISNIMYYDKKNKKGQRLTYLIETASDGEKKQKIKKRGMRISSERKTEILVEERKTSNKKEK